jgi:RNA 2',3'-cyclic 3'-phosphodiesterase
VTEGERIRRDYGKMARMETRRLFFALWPQPAQQAALVQATLGAIEWLGGTRVPPENLHITLVFVGSVPGADIARLQSIAGAVAADVGSGDVNVTLEALEYWKHPRVVCLTTGRSAVARASRIAELLRDRLTAAGFAPDPRPWRPHVTLARKVTPAGSMGTVQPVEWTFREFALVESQTGPTGSIYCCRSRFAWLIPLLVMLAVSLGSTAVRSASQQGGHADDRIHCRSDTPDAAIIACTHIIDDERLEEFERATALKNRAYHYQELGDVDHAIDDYNEYERASADFTRAIQLNPGASDAYRYRGFVHLQLHDTDAAIADLSAAVALNPNDAAADRLLSSARAEKKGRRN